MAEGTESVGGRALPRVRWGAIVAGVFLAVAVHIVLGLVGGALGIAAAPTGSTALGTGAVIWGIVTPLVATLLGAWLAVRMAGAADDRAGSTLHGILVWCIGLIAGALFFTGTLAMGAMTAGTASSAGVAAAQRIAGAPGRNAAARGADQAAAATAAAMGGAALASIAGLLGAVAGVGIARGRRSGRGLGWRIAIQRRPAQGEERYARPRERYAATGAPYGAGERHVGGTPGEAPQDVGGPPSADPYHH